MHLKGRFIYGSMICIHLFITGMSTKFINLCIIVKNMRYCLFVLLLIFSCLYGVMSIRVRSHKGSAIGDQAIFLKDSYNYFVTKEGNVVWAGALTLAWHQLTDNIIKEDVQLKQSNDVTQKIVQNFNKSPFKRSDLSESDFYIKSGYGQKTVTQINKQVKQKFPNRTFPDIDATLKDRDIISYAYLAKSFQYPVQFKKLEDFKFRQKSVKGFTASNSEQRRQVQYPYYKNDKQFMVKLSTKKANEGVYLIRTAYKSALVDDIIQQVIKWEDQPLSTMSEDDYFSMPVLDFDYHREMTQVENRQLLNEKFIDYYFSKVYEGLKLKVDQTGVKVENQGVIIMKTYATAVPMEIEHKYFIFDDTFWIVLKEKGKRPYLCIKVNQPTEKQSL